MNFQAQQQPKEMHPMNEGAAPRDVMNADETPSTPRGSAQVGEQRPTADDDVVLRDTRGRQISPLRTTMTVAQALDDSLGPRVAA